MFSKKTKTMLLVAIISLLHVACAPNKNDSNENDPAIEAMSSQLKSMGDEFLPASIYDDGRASSSSKISANKLSTNTNHQHDDICAGVDFIECQPRLIRAYLQMGREGVYTTQKIVSDVARSLSGVGNNTSGEFRSNENGYSISYNKRSSTDFDFLILENNISIGRVSAQNGNYNVQFDLNVIDKNKADSNGGKVDIQVKLTDSTHWQSQITFSGLKCNVNKPDDPETARIYVVRNGDIWNAQSSFYNGIGAQYNGTKSCSTPASDVTGVVIYTNLVADRTAAKAAMYLLRRNEQSVANLQNFGINNYCQNYPDLCQSLATASGQSTAAVATYLGALQNPYCVHRGNAQVFFNSDCSNVSAAVAQAPLLANTTFLSPYEFYRLNISIPNQL